MLFIFKQNLFSILHFKTYYASSSWIFFFSFLPSLVFSPLCLVLVYNGCDIYGR